LTKSFPGIGAAALATLVALCGCKKEDTTGAGPSRQRTQDNRSSGYFKTHFQDESQFIVETVLADLAEMTYFAQTASLPDPKVFSVQAQERPSSAFRAPVYDVEIVLPPNQAPLKAVISVSGPIWSPEVYSQIASQLFERLGLNQHKAVTPGTDDVTMMLRLQDASAGTIEKENQSVSEQLQHDFQNPALHAKAALLLGAFALREWSGEFYDVRLPLCRMTAHLTFARALTDKPASDLNALLADAMLETLMNNQVSALEKSARLDSGGAPGAAWARVLKARNSGDYRRLAELKSPTPLERIAWFDAFGRSVNPDLAWNRLDEKEIGQVPDFCRIANTFECSVETGHGLLKFSVPLELQEVRAIYEMASGQKLNREQFVPQLNQMPERCFSKGSNHPIQLRVIGWGQWAMFLQRQLCHALRQDFDFLEHRWGVPEEARKFSASCDQSFAGLRLYPFVRRFNATDVRSYRKSVDDAFPVTVATPHLVSPGIWNYLCYTVSFAPLYQPNPNPHINEWHKHNPPPGTAYFPLPRMNHPSLVNRPDTIAQIEKLHASAPYDSDISLNLGRLKYKDHPTYEQLLELYGPVLEYSAHALSRVAAVTEAQPGQFEKLMAKAAALDSDYYYNLSTYFIERTNETKTADYLGKAIALGSDSVTAANQSGWLIQYYLRQGQKEKARQLADMAGEAYSSRGLAAKAGFFETIGNYDEAFTWFAKIEERYNYSEDLMLFFARYKQKTGDTRFDNEAQKRLGKLFPVGIEKVTLSNFREPPIDGTAIWEDNNLIRQAGLKRGDIIVAVYGIRVHTFAQYTYGRETSQSPQLDLIVWQGAAYHEVHASPPKRHFGGKFGTYPAR
jgi:tetratricopeptide (TPR) repeat protein